MAHNVIITLDIAAPPEAVFDCLIDLSSHPKWNAHLISISPSIKLRPGAQYQTISRVLGRETRALNAVTAFEPPHLLAIENAEGYLRYSIRYELSSHEDGTRLSCVCDISSDSQIFNLATPVLEMVAHDKIKADLNAFKLLVQTGAKTAL